MVLERWNLAGVMAIKQSIDVDSINDWGYRITGLVRKKQLFSNSLYKPKGNCRPDRNGMQLYYCQSLAHIPAPSDVVVAQCMETTCHIGLKLFDEYSASRIIRRRSFLRCLDAALSVLSITTVHA